MDEQQQERFKQAVDRKARESEAASRATREREREPSGVRGDQESLRDASQPQDTLRTRDKSSRHKKVTADKWNQ